MKFPTFQTGRDNSKRYVNNMLSTTILCFYIIIYIIFLSCKSTHFFIIGKIYLQFDTQIGYWIYHKIIATLLSRSSRTHILSAYVHRTTLRLYGVICTMCVASLPGRFGADGFFRLAQFSAKTIIENPYNKLRRIANPTQRKIRRNL